MHKKKVIEEKLDETTDNRKRKSSKKDKKDKKVEDLTSFDNYKITEKTKQILIKQGITTLFPI